eukprot:scaffold645_cov31-Tisochrysis_lutea.AAC.1
MDNLTISRARSWPTMMRKPLAKGKGPSHLPQSGHEMSTKVSLRQFLPASNACERHKERPVWLVDFRRRRRGASRWRVT